MNNTAVSSTSVWHNDDGAVDIGGEKTGKTVAEKRFYRKRIMDLARRSLFFHSDEDRAFIAQLPSRVTDAFENFTAIAIDHFQYVDMVDFYQDCYSELDDATNCFAAATAPNSDIADSPSDCPTTDPTRVLDIFLHRKKQCPWLKTPTLDKFVILKTPPTLSAPSEESIVSTIIPVIRSFNPLDPALKEKGIRKQQTPRPCP